MSGEQERGWQLAAKRDDFAAHGSLYVKPGERLRLPDVTLVMVETREHELANYAVRESVGRVSFGEVLIFTDRPETFDDFGARVVRVPDWPEKIGWSRFTWQEIGRYVRTSHALCVQWDSWVVDPSAWRDEFLRYDYVGAPWWYLDGKNVGNGGFSLRSTALMRYLRKRRDDYPCTTALDDDLLCRTYRPRLQDAGFVWCPQDLALDFSFECVRPDPAAKHFGFHGCFNFHLVLTKEELLARAQVMAKSPYIISNAYMWSNFKQANQGLLPDELWTSTPTAS